MEYKAFFTDIDGTLLDDKKQVLQPVLNAINALKNNNVPVVLSTGRPELGINKVVKDFDLDNSNGFIVCYNGGKVISLKTKEVIFSKSLDIDLLEKIFDCAKSADLQPIIYSKTGILTDDISNEFVAIESEVTGMPLELFDGKFDSIDIPVHKCLVVGPPSKITAAKDIFERELGDVVDAYTSAPIFLEVMPKGINKAVGINAVLEYCNLTKQQAVACGDGFNDVDMLKFVGMGIAMENAVDGVKAYSNDIVPTNNESGVAHAIARYFPQYYTL